MTCLAHISDLHFGRERPGLPDALVAALEAARPDLIAVSGDLTQRARESQFARARALLDRLPAPWISVPGNHDIPLENWPLRLLRPFRAYRRAIGRNLEPELRVGAVRALGLNTVSPFLWQRGWLTGSAVRRACLRLEGAAEEEMTVLVAHHPFAQEADAGKDLMRGARRGIEALSDAGADVVLCGHLHSWRAAPFMRSGGRIGALQVQVGTSLSNRGRGEPNDFALLRFDGPGLEITRMAHDGEVFVPVTREGWRRGPEGWARVPAA